MKLIQFTEWFNLAIAVILTAAYFYQLVYLVIGLVHGRRTRKEHAPSRFHRFAAIIQQGMRRPSSANLSGT